MELFEFLSGESLRDENGDDKKLVVLLLCNLPLYLGELFFKIQFMSSLLFCTEDLVGAWLILFQSFFFPFERNVGGFDFEEIFLSKLNILKTQKGNLIKSKNKNPIDKKYILLLSYMP